MGNDLSEIGWHGDRFLVTERDQVSCRKKLHVKLIWTSNGTKGDSHFIWVQFKTQSKTCKTGCANYICRYR